MAQNNTNMWIIALCGVLALLVLMYGLDCTSPCMFKLNAVATVTAAVCTGQDGDHLCDLTLSYTPVGADPLTGVTLSAHSDTTYAVGDTVKVYYNSAHPEKVSLHQVRPSHNHSYMLLIGAMLIVSLPFFLFPMDEKLTPITEAQ